jgi:hypothetical protein
MSILLDALFKYAKPRGYHVVQVQNDLFELQRTGKKWHTGSFESCKKWLSRWPVVKK